MKKIKTAIFSLYQKHELARTKCFITNIKSQLTTNRQLFILVNDEKCHQLESFCKDISPNIVILNSGKNIGVASGRNFLLKHAIECGFNFFVSCDNDILYEQKYFSKIEDSYINLKTSQSKVGLIQPILLDGSKCKKVLNIDESSDWESIVNKVPDFSYENIHNKFLNSEKGLKGLTDSFYHTGISNIWLAHYDSKLDSKLKNQNKSYFHTEHRTLRSDIELLETLRESNKYIQVAATAGGVSAFDLDFLNENGFYNTKFDPFLYEDSEFGFRAYYKGFNNFLLTHCIGIHDVFMKNSNRVNIQYANIARLRGVEISYLEENSREKYFAISNSVLNCWKGIKKQVQLKNIKDNVARANYSDKFLLRYFINLFYGLFGTGVFPKWDIETNFFHEVFYELLNKKLENTNVRVSEYIYVCVGQAIFKKNNTKGFSLCLLNARFEETSENKRKNTRYFDFYLQINQLSSRLYDINIDIQQDDLTYNIVFKLNLENVLSNSIEAECFHDVQFNSKKYFFGNFSDEVIYPTPNFSEKAYKDLIGDLSSFAEYSRSSIGEAIIKLIGYDSSFVRLQPKDVKKMQHSSKLRNTEPFTVKKILVFTDSRGQHKPAGSNHLIFGERLAGYSPDIKVDLVLCPMKWTTTLDFLDYIDTYDISNYDAVILYTGIVEWSPRPQKSAINDLYNNHSLVNSGNWSSNTRNYSEKIVNNKKQRFDKLFGEKNNLIYLNSPFNIEYEGQKTINMYSLDMAKVIAQKLKKIDNLIFINSNRILSDWEGDFKRGRPKNMTITHKYSDIFSDILGPQKVIDISSWSERDIKNYTCDNMHLTKEGSDWIFERILEKLGLNDNKSKNNNMYFEKQLIKDTKKLLEFKEIERFGNNKKESFIKRYVSDSKYFATLIIGIKLSDCDDARLDNLNYLLEWINYYYQDMFDVLIVEQGSEKLFPTINYSKYDFVRYEFLYNPKEYNRGWGYNVAVKYFCESKVVVLMDTDVLTGSNFVADVRDCYIGKFDIISPYQNIYYTDKEEADSIFLMKSFNHLIDTKKIKNPVTITGGMVIFNRKCYLELKGFEQYIGYGCEDRSLDVMSMSLVDISRIKISPFVYIHLYHPSDQIARKNFEHIYKHLQTNYKCEWTPKLHPTDFIHSFCEHSSKDHMTELLIEKSKSFANIDLYKNQSSISINGQVERVKNISNSVILPPDFTSLNEYEDREIYNAPEADSAEIEKFRNAFLGERCFIIGNGPTLNEHDLSLLENEYTFGVNSFYYKTRETGFRPTFYVVEDSSVMKENIKEIKDYHAPFKFFPTIYKKLHPESPNTFFFKMNRGFYEKSSPNYCVPRFSTDASKELFCGQSVTYINLQLAYFMGFTEVYLIGMDFSYVIPESHKRTGDVLLSDSDDPNHFHKDYFGKGKTWKDPKLERVGMNYRMAKLAYESTGRKIYNATVGGSLEIFDRVNYNSLFDSVDSTENSMSFKEANNLYVAKRYSDALVVYLSLAENNIDFDIYMRAALDSYCLAQKNRQPVQVELIDRLKKLII